MTSLLEREIKTFFSWAWRNDLFELTYAYTIHEDRFFNRTLFSEYANCPLGATPEELISRVRKKLEDDILFLRTCIDSAADASDWLTSFCSRTLHYTMRMYTMIWRGVPFEVQKRLPEDDYTMYWLEECLQKVQEMDKELFGDFVLERSREVSRSECLLLNTYKFFSERLSDKEKEEYMWYVELLKTLPSYKADICNLDLSTSLLDNPIFDCLIPREVYIRLFSFVFDFYKLNIPVVVDERSSVYDWPEAMYIPNSDTYDSLSLRKVLNLIVHEIETHYIVLHNTDELVSWIKWAGNLSREEWLAIFQEFLLTWNELSEIDMRAGIPIILIWEIIDWKEYVKFLKLYRKLRWIAATWTDRLLRAKRGYPLWWTWVQHKDVSYSRWVYKVRNYLLEWGEFTDLFLAKVSFEDMAILSNNIDRSKVILPKQITMRLIFSLLASWDQKTYETLIQETSLRYPFLEKLLRVSLTKEEQKIFVALEQLVSSSLLHREE